LFQCGKSFLRFFEKTSERNGKDRYDMIIAKKRE
jgi:septum formation topological specificity factor MinE